MTPSFSVRFFSRAVASQLVDLLPHQKPKARTAGHGSGNQQKSVARKISRLVEDQAKKYAIRLGPSPTTGMLPRSVLKAKGLEKGALKAVFLAIPNLLVKTEEKKKETHLTYRLTTTGVVHQLNKDRPVEEERTTRGSGTPSATSGKRKMRSSTTGVGWVRQDRPTEPKAYLE